MPKFRPFSPRTQLTRDQRMWFQGVRDENVTSGGKVTLTAGTVTEIADANITTESVVILFATNPAAAALTGVYFAWAETVNGVSFKIRHGAAVGTETFNYIIYG